MSALTGVAVVLWALAAWPDRADRSRPWRDVWAAAQGGLLVFLWFVLLVARHPGAADRSFGPHWIATGLLFGLCLLQVRVGVEAGSRWWVNLALTSIGVHVVIAYCQLLGSMQTTGTLFVSAGALLIGLTVLLERQRRALALRIAGRDTEGHR